jgi:hypothetical protein
MFQKWRLAEPINVGTDDGKHIKGYRRHNNMGYRRHNNNNNNNNTLKMHYEV